jgi:hypothetical protein
MKTIQVTLQERWAASQHKVHKSKRPTPGRISIRKRAPVRALPFYLKLSFK